VFYIKDPYSQASFLLCVHFATTSAFFDTVPLLSLPILPTSQQPLFNLKHNAKAIVAAYPNEETLSMT
jgi:hypothetical protein